MTDKKVVRIKHIPGNVIFMTGLGDNTVVSSTINKEAYGFNEEVIEKQIQLTLDSFFKDYTVIYLKEEKEKPESESYGFVKTPKKQTCINFNKAEIQTSSRIKWAEGLILQMDELHDGRNSWLMNYGHSGVAINIRVMDDRDFKYDENTDSYHDITPDPVLDTTCPMCNGDGKVIYTNLKGTKQSDPVTCPKCDGTGEV